MLTRTLDEELLGLLHGEDDTCPVCGEGMAAQPGCIECGACGSVLEEVRRPEQLAVV